jgi:Txe/YoeB family toxin of Txe-Axe toxin-antitoxin module
MASQDHNQEFVERIKLALKLMIDSQYQKVDLSAIKNEDPEMATLLKQLTDTLKTTGQSINVDTMDIAIIGQHLSHISKTTESGVLTVLNISELLMSDTNKIRDTLDELENKLKVNETDQKLISGAHQILDEIQNNCFTILTSLEFEDINRQLMEKITNRLDMLYSNLLDSLVHIKTETLLERKDSVFLEGLKHIIDLDNSSRQSQEEIDDLFEEFS